MILTLSVLSFFFGFAAAAVITSKPKPARFTLAHTLNALRHVSDAFRSWEPLDQESTIHEKKDQTPTDEADLLTT